MLLHFLVASVQAGPRSKNIELGLRFSSQFNQDLAASDQALAAFCFPLGPEAQAPKEYMASEEYTFTLTKSDGSRFSGFCRRFLPPVPKQGPKLRYPRVICLITEAPWFVFFSKVLQTVEQLIKQSELLDVRDLSQLPEHSAPWQFLKHLSDLVATTPQLGSIIRVPLPANSAISTFSPTKRANLASPDFLASTDFIELQVPLDCGNGGWNAGISMARLLYHVPIPAMLTLIASMLLERRIILVGQSRDMVSAAVHAANAFLYPFRWHHIFLPLLPKHFKDYLTAPMPFLVGMPAQLLPLLKGIPMNEVTMIDLDLAKCEPAPGSRTDDALLLPWRDRLELALHTAYSQLRSPTEYESNPLITGIMQEYFLKLLGGYRKFVSEMEPAERTKGGRRKDDGIIYGDEMKFDHGAFTASFRGMERARNFVHMFRHSQMYEVFIQERLQLAPKNYVTDDIFECKVLLNMERRSRVQEMSSKVTARYNKTVSKLSTILKKHTRHASIDAFSLDGSTAGQRGLARVYTDSSLDRPSISGASTPASSSFRNQPPLLDLHQLFESESDAESEFSTFGNALSRHSDSGTSISDLDRSSMGTTRAESSNSMDPDNGWRAVSGISSTLATPKPTQATNLISLDDAPGSRPPDPAAAHRAAADPVPNLAPPPRTNPFGAALSQPSSHHQVTPPNPQLPYNKQPSATARFMSILDAALSTAAEPKSTAHRPPAFSFHPSTPAGTTTSGPRQMRENSLGGLLALYGKDAWSELTSVARDVRDSVREVRQTLNRNSYAQPFSTPGHTVPPTPRQNSFSNLAVPGEPGSSATEPKPAMNGKLPDQKLVDAFLTSSMVTLGLTPSTKSQPSQPGPSMQQLRSQSSLDATAQQAVLAGEQFSLSRTTSGARATAQPEASAAIFTPPQLSAVQHGLPATTSSSNNSTQPAWDPFDVLASSTTPTTSPLCTPTSQVPTPLPGAASAPNPTWLSEPSTGLLSGPFAGPLPVPLQAPVPSPTPDPNPTLISTPIAAPQTCPNMPAWDPFADAASSSSIPNNTFTPASLQLATTASASLPARTSSIPLLRSPPSSFTAFTSAPAAPVPIPPLPAPPMFSRPGSVSGAPVFVTNAANPPNSFMDDPFAMLAASSRPVAGPPTTSSQGMGLAAALHSTTSTAFPQSAAKAEATTRF